METDEKIKELKESEHFKKAREAFDTVFNYATMVFLRHDDHIKLNNAFHIVDEVLAKGVQMAVQSDKENEQNKVEQNGTEC